jgi:hypothetical protein
MIGSPPTENVALAQQRGSARFFLEQRCLVRYEWDRVDSLLSVREFHVQLTLQEIVERDAA